MVPAQKQLHTVPCPASWWTKLSGNARQYWTASMLLLIRTSQPCFPPHNFIFIQKLRVFFHNMYLNGRIIFSIFVLSERYHLGFYLHFEKIKEDLELLQSWRPAKYKTNCFHLPFLSGISPCLKVPYLMQDIKFYERFLAIFTCEIVMSN